MLFIVFEPTHEIMALFVLRKLILQTRMRSHPVGLDVWFLVGPFVYFHTSCVRPAKVVVRLRRCAGSPEPLLLAYVISTIISWAGSFGYNFWILLNSLNQTHSFCCNISSAPLPYKTPYLFRIWLPKHLSQRALHMFQIIECIHFFPVIHSLFHAVCWHAVRRNFECLV